MDGLLEEAACRERAEGETGQSRQTTSRRLQSAQEYRAKVGGAYCGGVDAVCYWRWELFFLENLKNEVQHSSSSSSEDIHFGKLKRNLSQE